MSTFRHHWELLRGELKLRLRRNSTWVVMLATIALSWAMLPDAKSGMALMTVGGARVLNTSAAMAFGSASLASILLGLASFYLARGQMSADVRCGVGAVIAATVVSNRTFLGVRWLGNVAYLLLLVLALLSTTLLLHALRGDGPIQLGVYLSAYSLMLMPPIFFGASMAVLFNSIGFLMGKLGDALFFCLWVAQFVVIAIIGDSKAHTLPLWAAFDFSGLAIGVLRLQHMLSSSDFWIGVSSFNPALAAISLPQGLWDRSAISVRLLSMLLATLPLLPAIFYFHRYSPDRVKAVSSRKRRSPAALINSWLRPLARLVQPIFRLAARWPGVIGQILAEMALCFASAPSSVLVILPVWIASAIFPVHALPLLLTGVIAYWGTLISNVSTRAIESNTEALSGAVPGGITHRYFCHAMASAAIGWLLVGVIALRWLTSAPTRAAILLLGLLSLGAWATALGHTARTARVFLVLFLFWLYACLNVPGAAMLDLAAIHGNATLSSACLTLALSSLALLIGLGYVRIAQRVNSAVYWSN